MVMVMVMDGDGVGDGGDNDVLELVEGVVSYGAVVEVFVRPGAFAAEDGEAVG